MSEKTKILIVEHDPSDIEILQYELRKGGIDFRSEVVQNEQGYSNALENFVPDIILSDFSLPSFDGPTAFKMREQLAPDIPFIFVSGNIGEENSIEYIKSGVTDYVLKDKLFTLTTKVKRALQESREKDHKKKKEQQRIQSERRLARAQQIAHLGSWELDFATDMVQLSEEACRIYGLPTDQCELSLEKWLSFVHLADHEFVSEKISQFRKSLRDSSFYYRIVQSGGSMRHIYSESKLEFDASGHPTGLYGIAHDVTEMKRVEEQMDFDRNNLTSLINNTNDSMWSLDKEFKLITSNQRFDELSRLVTGKHIAKGTSLLEAGYPPDQMNAHKRLYERAFLGESFAAIEYVGAPVESWSEVSYYPIRKGEEVIGSACYSRDITKVKLAELERIRMTNDLIERNKDLEQFAYIVSHNLRAPVANIIGITGLIHQGIVKGEEEKNLAGYLIASVKKIDEVINDLNDILQVKRDVSEKKVGVKFSELLGDIQLSIDHLIRKEEVQFIVDFTEIDEMQTLKSYLYSIFFNLISNSIKYRSPLVAPVIEITSRLSGNTISLLFKDNGLGIDLNKRAEQVFGLYKRFHSHTEGKGMGLYMVKAQVETLGGKIAVLSEVNKGTEFSIVFENGRKPPDKN